MCLTFTCARRDLCPASKPCTCQLCMSTWHPQTLRKLQNSTRIALLQLNCIMSTSRRDSSERIIHQKLGWLFDYVEFIVLPSGATTVQKPHFTLLSYSDHHCSITKVTIGTYPPFLLCCRNLSSFGGRKSTLPPTTNSFTLSLTSIQALPGFLHAPTLLLSS